MKILPIFIPHLGCPYRCIYCDQHIITGTSVQDEKEIIVLISRFCENNRDHEKEIAFYGGTFTNLDKQRQRYWLKLAGRFSDSRTRIRISSRPDCIDPEVLKFCREHGINTIELGIQSFSDHVLNRSKRGYDRKTALEACHMVSNGDLELGIQLMPGLPDFSPESWAQTRKDTLRIKPAFIRLYPAVVLKGTELEEEYRLGNYIPLSLEESIRICAGFIRESEERGIKVIKTGLHSDIETSNIIAGPYNENFGELVRGEILCDLIIDSYQPGKTLEISERDVSLLKGNGARGLGKLRSALGIEFLPVIRNRNLKSGNFLFTSEGPAEKW